MCDIPKFNVAPPKKLKTFKLTKKGKIDAIRLGTASSDDSELAVIIETRGGNFHKLGTDGQFHPLPKAEENN